MAKGNPGIRLLGHGPPLVLLHGALVDSSMWDPQVSAFSQQFSIFLVDLPSHGRALDIQGEFNIEAVAGDILDRLQRAKVENFHLCGHSLGGMVAQFIAASVPHKIRKLGLAESAFGTRNNFWESIQSLFAEPILALMSKHQIIGLSTREYGKIRPETGDFLNDQMQRYDKPTILRVMQSALDYAGKELLTQIQAQTLILVGENNRRTHGQAKVMARLIPKSDLKYIPKASHMLNLDNPESFNQMVVEFLSK